MKTLDFYFDFMSPFAYLAHHEIPALARSHDLELRLRVVDLPTLKRLAGNTGPRNVDIPPKIRYLKADLQRWAKRYGVPLVFPPSLASARLNRGFFFAVDRDAGADFVSTAWRMVWGEGRDMGDESLFGAIAAQMGWSRADFLDYTDSAEATERYERETEAAAARGVFGVPTMIVDDQMWWGNDRIDFLREYLAAT
ncbi:2-hydroxychromene-2-carboxylate isomerase [Pinisolibacter sp.]|uniref:2-hydroxychromene-2-carboxylate isomerase n=1 Tax=Pinisolibacter sp. TaxID=2172024 RepID=UPI002FDCCFDA